MRDSRDIETLLYEELTKDGHSASAHVIPQAISSPHIHVVRTGGYERDMVIEVNLVDFDVYADDAATAMETASALCGWVRDLDCCYASDITTLPYHNPDPRHPNIARVTFKAQILTRTVERN